MSLLAQAVSAFETMGTRVRAIPFHERGKATAAKETPRFTSAL
jgi:hypothetical protein